MKNHDSQPITLTQLAFFYLAPVALFLLALVNIAAHHAR